VESTGVWVSKNSGSSLGQRAGWTPWRVTGDRGTFFADTSGDGKADVIAADEAGLLVGVATTGAFSATSNWSGGTLRPASHECATEPGSGTYCSASCPCAEADGDCDSDAQCAPGLVCATDQGAGYGMASTTDVCLTPACEGRELGSATYCSSECRCGLGGGNCSAHIDCIEGYVCEADYGRMFGQAPDADVCVAFECTGRSVGGSSFCSANCPCGRGGGDCDSDGQCMPGLVCASDHGKSFGMSSTTDVCLPASCSTRTQGSSTYCSSDCPCGQGGGDCDSDAQCMPGLRCGTDNGPSFGYSATTDVCVP
jgi:hypothetical protein